MSSFPFEKFPIWHHPYQSLKSNCDFTNQLLFKEMMKVFEPVTLTGLDSLPNGNYKSPTMRWIAKRYTFRTRRTVINVDYSADAFEGWSRWWSPSVNSIYEFYSKQKSGQISIISSVAGYRGLPAAGAYCSSKSALISFTESLYFDMIKKNVDVKLINPGFIKTPITEKNKNPMPMIKSPEFAANEIFIGLTQKKLFEIHFPKSFTFLMKFMQILPIWLYFKLINIGNIYMKRD